MKKRNLPSWINKCTQKELIPAEYIRNASEYLTMQVHDGLVFLELRDAILEGDGPRIIRCWKFMLLLWHLKGHTKYVSEAVHLICAIEATVSSRIFEELTWCRTVNTCGKPGKDIPADLFLEHLNRKLKDTLNGPIYLKVPSFKQESHSSVYKI